MYIYYYGKIRNVIVATQMERQRYELNVRKKREILRNQNKNSQNPSFHIRAINGMKIQKVKHLIMEFYL